jgi:hypothetical protein
MQDFRRVAMRLRARLFDWRCTAIGDYAPPDSIPAVNYFLHSALQVPARLRMIHDVTVAFKPPF